MIPFASDARIRYAKKYGGYGVMAVTGACGALSAGSIPASRPFIPNASLLTALPMLSYTYARR